MLVGMLTNTSPKWVCSVEGCERPRRAKGLCSMHYQRQRTVGVECSIDGCGNKMHAKGMCQKHYNLARRVGRVCSVEGCDETVHAREWCVMHYSRVLKYGDPGEADRRRRAEAAPCKVEGCELSAKSRQDLCSHHARMKRLYGTEAGTFRTHKKCVVCGSDATYGPKSSDHCGEHYVDFVKGEVVAGRIKGRRGRNGYETVSIFKKNYSVHRIVMEDLMGRPLHPYEEVHHINGVRDDNRPENLELWVKSQPAGQRVADLVAWVIREYPAQVIEAANDISRYIVTARAEVPIESP